MKIHQLLLCVGISISVFSLQAMKPQDEPKSNEEVRALIDAMTLDQMLGEIGEDKEFKTYLDDEPISLNFWANVHNRAVLFQRKYASSMELAYFSYFTFSKRAHEYLAPKIKNALEMDASFPPEAFLLKYRNLIPQNPAMPTLSSNPSMYNLADFFRWLDWVEFAYIRCAYNCDPQALALYQSKCAEYVASKLDELEALRKPQTPSLLWYAVENANVPLTQFLIKHYSTTRQTVFDAHEFPVIITSAIHGYHYKNRYHMGKSMMTWNRDRSYRLYFSTYKQIMRQLLNVGAHLEIPTRFPKQTPEYCKSVKAPINMATKYWIPEMLAFLIQCGARSDQVAENENLKDSFYKLRSMARMDATFDMDFMRKTLISFRGVYQAWQSRNPEKKEWYFQLLPRELLFEVLKFRCDPSNWPFYSVREDI